MICRYCRGHHYGHANGDSENYRLRHHDYGHVYADFKTNAIVFDSYNFFISFCEQRVLLVDFHHDRDGGGGGYGCDDCRDRDRDYVYVCVDCHDRDRDYVYGYDDFSYCLHDHGCGYVDFIKLVLTFYHYLIIDEFEHYYFPL